MRSFDVESIARPTTPAPANPATDDLKRETITWPEGKAFAFSIFDDPDAQGLEDGKVIYSRLAELGFRTTRGVWSSPATREPNSGGETCANPEYLAHTLELQAAG